MGNLERVRRGRLRYDRVYVAPQRALQGETVDNRYAFLQGLAAAPRRRIRGVVKPVAYPC